MSRSIPDPAHAALHPPCRPYRVLDPHAERVLDPQGAPGLVEPDVPHQVGLLGAVRFRVEFYRLPAASSAGTAKEAE